MRTMRATRLRLSVATATVGLAAGALLLAACAPQTPGPAQPTASASGTASATPTAAVADFEIAPFPTGQSNSTTPLPADCAELLTPEMAAELDGIALNAPGMGGGIREDSTRVCVWADPGATRTRLVLVIGYAPERAASDALFVLGRDEGYDCYTPDGGVRCEKTWESGTLGLPEGRTLFYRDGVIIDTQYANLAPAGFTASVIDTVWP